MARRIKPVTRKHTECGQRGGMAYAVSSMQGWRTTMEDTHKISLSLRRELKGWAFAGVFDGHGGKMTSEYASKNLLPHISKQVRVQHGLRRKGQIGTETNRVKNGIITGFLNCDKAMSKEKAAERSGTTACCVLLSPTHLYVANCGDSRAVLCRAGKVGFATRDHKPNMVKEKARIEKAGGFVTKRRISRVQGILAMSRALGDFKPFKEDQGIPVDKQMVIPIPDVTVMERDFYRDEFIVLACDGIFDVISNYELITYIRHQMARHTSLTNVCNNVIDHCLKKKSKDNMSIIIITLPGCPTHEELNRKRKADFAQIKQRAQEKRKKPNEAGDEEGTKRGDELTLKLETSTTTSHPKMQVQALSPLAVTKCRHTVRVVLKHGNIKRRRENMERSKVPNPFIMYHMDNWKRSGGNICKAAKTSGEKWRNLRPARKAFYQRKYALAKQKFS